MKNELKNRREFFKEAAKKALPILGAVALMSNPVIANAMVNESLRCSETSCYQGCYAGCKGCQYSCEGTCSGGCRDTCQTTCKDKCQGSCKAICTYGSNNL